MPKLLKAVIVIIIWGIFCELLSLPSIRSMFWILINLGILSGFRNRSAIACNFARTVSLFGLVSYVLITIIYISSFMLAPELTQYIKIIISVLLLGILLQLFIFLALGTTPIKNYFGIPQKNKK